MRAGAAHRKNQSIDQKEKKKAKEEDSLQTAREHAWVECKT